MSKVDIQTLVLQRTVNILRGQSKARRGAMGCSGVGERDTSMAVCIDLQNLHHFFTSACGIPASRVDVVALVRDLAARQGLVMDRLHVFTGIHDQREATKMRAMERRLSWFRREGAVVTAIPLSYSKEVDGWRAKEKGVDVAMGAEIVRLAHEGWRNVLVFSQDRDLAAAVDVARRVTGYRVNVLSLRLDGDDVDRHGRCATSGLEGTDKIGLTRADVEAYTRPSRHQAGADN